MKTPSASELLVQESRTAERLRLYLRTLIAGKEIHPRPCTHHADLLRKVAGLCNNANQLAHRANSTGTAGQGSVDEMTRLTQEVWREVKENW